MLFADDAIVEYQFTAADLDIVQRKIEFGILFFFRLWFIGELIDQIGKIEAAAFQPHDARLGIDQLNLAEHDTALEQ